MVKVAEKVIAAPYLVLILTLEKLFWVLFCFFFWKDITASANAFLSRLLGRDVRSGPGG